MKRRLRTCLAAAAIPWLAMPALAQESPEPKPSEARDQDERVCEKITMVGSRLATKRFCGTRAEWEDKKRQDRESIDRMQRVPCLPGATSC